MHLDNRLQSQKLFTGQAVKNVSKLIKKIMRQAAGLNITYQLQTGTYFKGDYIVVFM
jgi:hypothetical protein